MKKIARWLIAIRFTNDEYDALKRAVEAIPYFGAAYLAASKIWGFGLAPEIAETLIIIETLLLNLLKISSINYYKETVEKNESGNLDNEEVEHQLEG